jgi:formate hydrogenlyase subunit 4
MSSSAGPALLLVAAALAVVFLAENARIPVDDPNTHLELTMIHEVMVLDHSGPDFAMIQYAATLKLWVLGALLTGILVPVRSGWWPIDLAAGLAGMGVVAVATGVIESMMARLRLIRVPQVLVAASVLSVLALVFVLR